MQWTINLKSASSIEFIGVYVQLQFKKETQIVFWDNGEPLVTMVGEEIYGNRLKTHLSDSKFALKITNALYNDSGNYSMSVLSMNPIEITHSTVPAFVYGMLFCYFKVLMFSKGCQKVNPLNKNK